MLLVSVHDSVVAYSKASDKINYHRIVYAARKHERRESTTFRYPTLFMQYAWKWLSLCKCYQMFIFSFAHQKIMPKQGILTKGKGSVQLTSVYLLVQTSSFSILIFFYKTTYFNEEFNCTEPSHSVRIPCLFLGINRSPRNQLWRKFYQVLVTSACY